MTSGQEGRYNSYKLRRVDRREALPSGGSFWHGPPFRSAFKGEGTCGFQFLQDRDGLLRHCCPACGIDPKEAGVIAKFSITKRLWFGVRGLRVVWRGFTRSLRESWAP